MKPAYYSFVASQYSNCDQSVGPVHLCVVPWCDHSVWPLCATVVTVLLKWQITGAGIKLLFGPKTCFTDPPNPQIIVRGPSGTIPDQSEKNPEICRKPGRTRPGSPNMLVHFGLCGVKPLPLSAPARDSLPEDGLEIRFGATRRAIRSRIMLWAGLA